MAVFGTKDWIGTDKSLFSRHAERRNVRFVANLGVGERLLKKKCYHFQSSPGLEGRSLLVRKAGLIQAKMGGKRVPHPRRTTII